MGRKQSTDASRDTLRSLARAALFAAVRGAATAASTGVIGLLAWWLQRH